VTLKSSYGLELYNLALSLAIFFCLRFGNAGSGIPTAPKAPSMAPSTASSTASSIASSAMV